MRALLRGEGRWAPVPRARAGARSRGSSCATAWVVVDAGESARHLRRRSAAGGRALEVAGRRASLLAQAMLVAWVRGALVPRRGSALPAARLPGRCHRQRGREAEWEAHIRMRRTAREEPSDLCQIWVMLQRVAPPGARQGWDDRKGVSALALKSNVDEGEISNLPISPFSHVRREGGKCRGAPGLRAWARARVAPSLRSTTILE